MTSSDLLPKNEDVVLACAFIPDATKRTEVLSLYAFLDTLREIPERTTEPLMGEIRLRWWFEAIEEIRDGRPVRYHPLTEALKGLIGKYGLEPQIFLDVIEGQMPLLDKSITLRTVLDVVDTGDTAIFKCAARIVAPGAVVGGIQSARLSGIVSLLRRRALSTDQFGMTEFGHLMTDVRADFDELDPVLLPLALPGVLAAAEFRRGRSLGPLAKRLKLLWTYLTGRI